jgi:hypothetical protein
MNQSQDLNTIMDSRGVSDHHVEVHTEGAEYTVGERFHIGESVAGWEDPATLEVTTVGDGGTLASLDIVDGGIFTGEGSAAGDYTLSDPLPSVLLLKARASSEVPSEGARRGTGEGLGAVLGSGAVVFVGLGAVAMVAAAAVVVRRRRAGANGSDEGDGAAAVQQAPAFPVQLHNAPARPKGELHCGLLDTALL